MVRIEGGGWDAVLVEGVDELLHHTSQLRLNGEVGALGVLHAHSQIQKPSLLVDACWAPPVFPQALHGGINHFAEHLAFVLLVSPAFANFT